MELAVITLIALACSTVMSILAFTIGRCGRKLPIDGMLPPRRLQRTVQSRGRQAPPRPATRKTQLALCRQNIGDCWSSEECFTLSYRVPA
jgi:hypothetical protein